MCFDALCSFNGEIDLEILGFAYSHLQCVLESFRNFDKYGVLVVLQIMARTGDQPGSTRQQPSRNTRPKKPAQPKESSKRKGKEVATASNPDFDGDMNEEEVEYTCAPWPRPENTPFLGGRAAEIPNITVKALQKISGFYERRPGHAWDWFNDLFYNGQLRISMVPTKFVCERTLQRLGVADDVKGMLAKMGLGTLPYKTYPLYPELVRQFLASVELQYKDIAIHRASEGTLTYLSSGILYKITIPELCDLYGFDRHIESCSFPSLSSFQQIADELWRVIGRGHFYTANSRKSKLTLIRNPVIRIVAKILGHSLNAKEETGSLRTDELMLLHYGLPDSARAIYEDMYPSELTTNLGAAFASMLVQKKYRGLKEASTRKQESVGSLLTPIFRFNGIDLSTATCVKEPAFYDEKFLRSTQILEQGTHYQYYDRDGYSRSCKLPLPDLTAPTSRQNLEFFLAPEHLVPDTTGPPPPPAPASHRRRGGSSSSHVPHPHLEQSQKAQHSMHKKMWNAIAKLGSCFNGRATARDSSSSRHPAARHSSPEDDEDDEDEETAAAPRSRRRRAQGQSQSNSSDGDI